MRSTGMIPAQSQLSMVRTDTEYVFASSRFVRIIFSKYYQGRLHLIYLRFFEAVLIALLIQSGTLAIV